MLWQATFILVLLHYGCCSKTGNGSFDFNSVKPNLRYDEICVLDGAILKCNNTNMKMILKPFDLCQRCGLITDLRIENGSLEVVKKSDLKHYPYIAMFSARNNEITQLHDRIFSKNKRLKRADLSGNKIKNIDSITFYGSPQLEILDLSKNRISVIPIFLFERLRSLRELNMQQNRLFILFSKLFDGLFNLEILDLSDNDIVYIDKTAFAGLDKLTHLDMSGNLLKAVPQKIVSNLPMLKFFNASNTVNEKWKALDRGREHFWNSTTVSSVVDDLLTAQNGSHIHTALIDSTSLSNRTDGQQIDDVIFVSARRYVIIASADKLSPINITFGALVIVLSLFLLYMSWQRRQRHSNFHDIADKELI